MKIKTTHVGSLPRPAEMITRTIKKQEIGKDDLKTYLADIIERQIALGITFINNGELPRADYVTATVSRLSGFHETGVAPMPRDLEDLPELSRRFGSRNGLITLNPKAPVRLPACSDKVSYVGESSLREELETMIAVFDQVKKSYPESDAQLFFTAPSPGTVALFFEDRRNSGGYDAYLEELAEALKQEYEIIHSYGVQLQVDCPDLAMGRHTKYKHLDDDEFLTIIDANAGALNRALENVPAKMCRAHICWGNYPGTHHRDIDLRKIADRVMKIDPRYISLEASNHRHAHEWEVFADIPLPEDKVLMPGVIDTASQYVEHPELVAHRIRNFANILGAKRVIGSTDCGFASTASATSVSGEVAWLKLKALIQGAELAGGKLS